MLRNTPLPICSTTVNVTKTAGEMANNTKGSTFYMEITSAIVYLWCLTFISDVLDDSTNAKDGSIVKVQLGDRAMSAVSRLD